MDGIYKKDINSYTEKLNIFVEDIILLIIEIDDLKFIDKSNYREFLKKISKRIFKIFSKENNLDKELNSILLKSF